MKIIQYKTNEEWLYGREGNITGTRLKDLAVNITKEMVAEELTRLGVEFKKTDKKEVLLALLSPDSISKIYNEIPKKKGFYEVIAERVAIPPDEENRMDRGHRLEDLAIDRFELETEKVVNRDLVMWAREDYERIAVSPDGYIEADVITEAIEVKCLNSASHCEAYLTGQIPSEYTHQQIQYFIVNENLKFLYFVFFDPRMPKDFFYFTVTRESLEKEIQEYFDLEVLSLKQMEEAEQKLTF